MIKNPQSLGIIYENRHKRVGILNYTGITTLIFACAILGSQRFLLPNLYALICLIPFIISIIYNKKNPNISYTALLISLFLAVDNGAGIYFETPGPIRYLIYAFAVHQLIKSLKFIEYKLIASIAFIALISIQSLLAIETIDPKIYHRDLLLVILAVIVISSSSNSIKKITINDDIIYKFFLIYLICELINYIFYFKQATGDYLNFDTNKTLILYPTFFLLTKKKFISSIAVAAITLPVLIGYTTRMIAVAYAIAIAIFLLGELVKNKNKAVNYLVGALILISLINFTNNIELDLTTNKIFGIINSLINNSDYETILRSIDTVRYDENRLFFSQDIVNIILGNGFGAGIQDKNGFLNYVAIGQSAFSAEEINSKIFYGLHDVWTDIGLRYGLIFVIPIIYFTTKYITSNTQNTSLFALNLFVLILCAFYSTKGVITIAMFALLLRNTLTQQRSERLRT